VKILMLVGEDTVGKKLYLLKNFDVIVSIWSDEKDRISKARELMGTGTMFNEAEKAIVFRELDKWSKKDLKKLRQIVEEMKLEKLNIVLDVQDEKRLKGHDFHVDEKHEFRLPKPWEDERWIRETQELAEELGTHVNTETARALLNRLGQNKELIYAELCKLSMEKTGEIREEDIFELTPILKPEGLENFLEMVGKRSRQAVEVLKEIPASVEVSLVISGLYSMFKDLLTLKLHFPQGEKVNWKIVKKLSTDLKISTGKVAKFLGFKFKSSSSAVNILDLWGIKEIERVLVELQRLEQGIKDGLMEPHVALYIFIRKFVCKGD